jgi:hypothetical protein
MNLSRFLGAPFQFSKRAAGEAAEFSRSGIELLGMTGAARVESHEPAAEASEFIRLQVGNRFGDFFDFHVADYSTAESRSNLVPNEARTDAPWPTVGQRIT